MLHGTNDPRLIRGKTEMAPVALIDVLCRPCHCGVHFVLVPNSDCKKRGVAGDKEVKQKCSPQIQTFLKPNYTTFRVNIEPSSNTNLS